MHWVSRRLPPGVRHAAVAVAVARHARRADVVYATSMVGRTALGCLLARRPFVAKLTSDPAFERSHRRELGAEGAVSTALRTSGTGACAAPRTSCARASTSRSSLRRGAAPAGSRVLPNPAPAAGDALPVALPAARPLVAFAGRLTAAKNLDAALRAVERVPEATLVVIGDGEERHDWKASPASACGSSVRGRAARCSASSRRPTSRSLRRRGRTSRMPPSRRSRWERPSSPRASAASGDRRRRRERRARRARRRRGVRGRRSPASSRTMPSAQAGAAAAPSVGRFAADAVYGELERILVEAAG